jgi:tetratricopeptide (TPR) repeat protein
MIKACSEILDDRKLNVGQQIEALQNRAWGYIMINEEDEAEDDIKAILDLDPNDWYAYSLRGTLHGFKGKTDLARRDFDRGVALARAQRQEFKARFERGRFLLHALALDEALGDFNAMIAMEPKRAAGYVGRALVLKERNDFAVALRELTRAINLEAEHHHAYVTRAEVFVGLKDLPSALTDYEMALRLAPDLPAAVAGREQVIGRMRDEAMAAATPEATRDKMRKAIEASSSRPSAAVVAEATSGIKAASARRFSILSPAQRP